MSDLDIVNALLAEIAEANDGTNHGSEYSLSALPFANSMTLALDAYFSAMSTSSSPPQPSERWNIRTTMLADADSELRSAARRWFYELEYSPVVDNTTSERTLNEFMNRLRTIVGSAKAVEVNVDPPVWYECTWQDFAFDGDAGRWILHFGFSD